MASITAMVEMLPNNTCEKTTENFRPPRNPSICMKKERATQTAAAVIPNGNSALIEMRSAVVQVKPNRSKSEIKKAPDIQDRSASRIHNSSLLVFIASQSDSRALAPSLALQAPID